MLKVVERRGISAQEGWRTQEQKREKRDEAMKNSKRNWDFGGG